MTQLILTISVIALVVVGRIATPSWWDGLPTWARRIPVVAIAIANALVDLVQAAPGAVDWNAVGETAWTTGATAFGAVELLKVLPWSRLLATLKRLGALLSLGAIVLLTGCGLTPGQTAAAAIDTACALGLVQSGAVIAEAELEGVPVEWLAEQLCSHPELYQEWLRAQQARSADPGRDVVRAARARSLVR